MILIWIFLNYFLNGYFASEFVSTEVLTKAANLCCPENSRKCCVEKLVKDEIVNCETDSFEAKKAAICLENFFFNHSIIEENAYKCCFLLNTKSCRDKCNVRLKKSTLPFHEKFTFTDDCPVPSLKEVEKVPKHKYSCLENANYTLHWCFGECLGWYRAKNVTQSTGSVKTLDQILANKSIPTSNPNEEYNPHLHCKKFKEFVEADPCIRVLSLENK